MFDSFYLPFVIESNTTVMAHLKVICSCRSLSW